MIVFIMSNMMIIESEIMCIKIKETKNIEISTKKHAY